MPVYTIRDPQTGQTVHLRGDSPPTEQELEGIFKSLQPQPQVEAAHPAGPQDEHPQQRSWTDTVVDSLPAAGATVGGILGGIGGTAFGLGFGGVPGSVGGAALGGSAGEATRELVNRFRGKEAPASAGEAASEIATEGLKQGALDAVGGAVGKYAIQPVARGFTKFAFKPTAQALKLNPEIAQDILDNSIGLSQKGLGKAEARTTASRQVADQMVEDLENQPNKWLNHPQTGTFGTKRASVQAELVDPVFNTVRKGSEPNAVGSVEQRALKQAGRKALDNAEQDLITSNPIEVGPKRLHEIMRAEGRAAGQIWTQGSEKQAVKGKIAADIHNAADDALGRRIGPEWNAANKETQRRLSVLRTVEDALGLHQAENHVPNPGDQFLLMRGLATGDPLGTTIALAREAGRFKPLVAAMGRGANQVQKNRVQTEVPRYLRELMQEDEEAGKQRTAERRRRKKTEVTSLYNRYNQERER